MYVLHTNALKEPVPVTSGYVFPGTLSAPEGILYMPVPARYDCDRTPAELKKTIGKKYSDVFIIDFSIWEDLLYLDDKSSEEIVNQLKEINRTLERLNSSIDKFKENSEEIIG